LRAVEKWLGPYLGYEPELSDESAVAKSSKVPGSKERTAATPARLE